MRSLPEAIDQWVKVKADEVAFIDYDGNQGWTWAEFSSLSDWLAEKIASEKEGTGRAMVCTRQNVLFPATLLACWRRGILPVLIHENYTEYEFDHVKDRLSETDPLVLLDDSFPNEVVDKFAGFTKNIKLLSPRVGDRRRCVFPAPDPKSFALGLWTSGTSNSPKLILFTHAELLAAARIEAANEPLFRNGLIANLRPHFTSGGLNTLWPSMLLGAVNVFSEKIRQRPIARFLREFLSSRPVTLLVLSPSYISVLLESLEKGPISAGPIPLYFGGMALPQRQVEALLDQGLVPSMRYGMTEIGHIVAKKALLGAASNTASVGRPFPGFELKIVKGYLATSSPGCAGYQLVNGVAQPLRRDGWFVTDDKASFSPEGEILLEGREHEIFCVNGFRFHSGQIREILDRVGLLADCRVMAFPNENMGQEIAVYAIPADPEKPLGEIEGILRKQCERLLSPPKRPRFYFFLREWPILPNGKISLPALRRVYEERASQ